MHIGNVAAWDSKENVLLLTTESAIVSITMSEDDIIRVRFNKGTDLAQEDKYVVEKEILPRAYKLTEEANGLTLKTSKIELTINFSPLSLKVKNASGKMILETTLSDMADAEDSKSTLRFKLENDEKIYGLGQDPMGNVNQRDKERRMWNEWGGLGKCANVGIPFYLSSNGYGLLLNSAWPARFAIGKAAVSDSPPPHSIPRAMGPWQWSVDSGETNPNQMAVLLEYENMDVFIVCRTKFDDMLRGYADLTGHAPMPPKWAFGFMQSKNRYRSQDELLAVAAEYRRRKIPCDVMVIDWLWFKEFGDMQWDTKNWPNPKEMMDKLKAMGFYVMQAQHPFVDKKSAKYNEFKDKGYLMGTPDDIVPIYDHSNPEARKYWWEKSKPFYEEGIRAFWTDMGEPRDHPKGSTAYLEPRERIHNLYCMLWSKSMYEGQRSDYNQRVFILSRTATAGIQRYGAALWSNDIDSSWEVLKDQVPAGLSTCLAGMEYWCTDIGGFATDTRFSAELFIRWMQWGVFCPLFRTHGTRPDNEAWSYGEEATEIITEFIRLRYRLIPYIYSCARQITESGTPMMRAMCMDYPNDPETADLKYQYMFGPSLLVAPVLDPEVRSLNVYLPEGEWYDYWTGKKYFGGKWIEAAAPLCRIPLFVKSGSILPLSPVMQYIGEQPLVEVELHVYGEYPSPIILYEDDGDSYDYELGNYVKTKLSIDLNEKIHVQVVEGDPAFIPKGRKYTVVTHTDANTAANDMPELFIDTDVSCDGRSRIQLTVDANGEEIRMKATISLSEGWTLKRGSNYLRKNPLPWAEAVSKTTAKLFWEATPVTDILPVINEAKLSIELTYRGKTQKIERTVCWGSGYATRWSTIGFFDNKSERDRKLIKAIESDPSLAIYTQDERTLRWHHAQDEEFNCQGYVDVRHASHSGMNNGNGTAFSKCKIWSDEIIDAYVELAAERYIRIDLNSTTVFEYEGILLRTTLDEPFHLNKGWNYCLIKSSVNFDKQMSGREMGFNLKLMDKNGEALKSLLFIP